MLCENEIRQRLSNIKKSICEKCSHRRVCRAIDNQPCFECNQFEQEVVRCKDCKHFIQEEHGCNHFGYYSHTPWVDEVDFCSYGERREGE
jgi:hypothetical protein